MDTEKQPHDETITVEKKPEEEKPAQTIADTVSNLAASSATLIAHSAEAVVDRFKEATIGSPPAAKKKKRSAASAKPAKKAKKSKKTAKTTPKKSRGKTMAKKAKKKTAKAATKKTAKKTKKKARR